MAIEITLNAFEKAILRSLGMSEPRVYPVELIQLPDGSLDRPAKLEYRAVIVRANGKTIEALGASGEQAARNAIRVAVSK